MGDLVGSKSKKRKRIDLSFDSPTVFTTRRDPVRTPKLRDTELPMSSPTSMRASQESSIVEFPDFLGHVETISDDEDDEEVGESEHKVEDAVEEEEDGDGDGDGDG